MSNPFLEKRWVMQEKDDLKIRFKTLYSAKKEPQEILVPPMQFLMVDGNGAPEGEPFQIAIQMLFSVSYTVKFLSKKEFGYDYTVMALEGLWWGEEMGVFSEGNKENWKWTLMIMQPEKITESLLDRAKEEVERKKKLQNLDQLRFETVNEGQSMQIMHIGPFSEEAEPIQKIHRAILERGGTFDGIQQKHHEIYLSDFRKANPSKLKTILRQPFVLNKA